MSEGSRMEFSLALRTCKAGRENRPIGNCLIRLRSSVNLFKENAIHEKKQRQKDCKEEKAQTILVVANSHQEVMYHKLYQMM